MNDQIRIPKILPDCNYCRDTFVFLAAVKIITEIILKRIKFKAMDRERDRLTEGQLMSWTGTVVSKHVLRAVLVDLEPGTMDLVRNRPFGHIL